MLKKKEEVIAASITEAAIEEVEDVLLEEVLPEAEVEVEEVLPKGVIRVRAVIRSFYDPIDGITIPDEGAGVLVKRGSWVNAQLERRLLQEC